MIYYKGNTGNYDRRRRVCLSMVYLDHASAARPPRAVLEYFYAMQEAAFANQEAAHRLGYEARKKLDEAADAARNLLDAMDREGYPAADTDHAITNFHLAFSSWIYLESIAFQAASGAGSRGSAAVLRADNSVIPENPAFRAQVLGTTVTPQGVRVGWEPCRPFPETDGWFETVWAEFRTGKIYG